MIKRKSMQNNNSPLFFFPKSSKSNHNVQTTEFLPGNKHRPSKISRPVIPQSETNYKSYLNSMGQTVSPKHVRSQKIRNILRRPHLGNAQKRSNNRQKESTKNSFTSSLAYDSKSNRKLAN
jgi:hypothetical protein